MHYAKSEQQSIELAIVFPDDDDSNLSDISFESQSIFRVVDSYPNPSIRILVISPNNKVVYNRAERLPHIPSQPNSTLECCSQTELLPQTLQNDTSEYKSGRCKSQQLIQEKVDEEDYYSQPKLNALEYPSSEGSSNALSKQARILKMMEDQEYAKNNFTEIIAKCALLIRRQSITQEQKNKFIDLIQQHIAISKTRPTIKDSLGGQLISNGLFAAAFIKCGAQSIQSEKALFNYFIQRGMNENRQDFNQVYEQQIKSWKQLQKDSINVQIEADKGQKRNPKQFLGQSELRRSKRILTKSQKGLETSKQLSNRKIKKISRVVDSNINKNNNFALVELANKSYALVQLQNNLRHSNSIDQDTKFGKDFTGAECLPVLKRTIEFDNLLNG